MQKDLTKIDYEESSMLKAQKLKNKIKKQSLENFFGKIQNILPFSETEFLIISNYGKNYVKFELENEKICDISLDQL